MSQNSSNTLYLISRHDKKETQIKKMGVFGHIKCKPKQVEMKENA